MKCRAGFLGIALIYGAVAGGCVSVAPYVGPLPLPSPDSPPPVLEPLSGPLSLDLAVRRALQSSSDLAILLGEADVARKEILSAGDIRDPEVRLGYGEMDADTTRTGWGTQTSIGSERGTRTETQSEAQRQTRAESSIGQATKTFTDGSPPRDVTSSSQSLSTSDASSLSSSTEDFSRVSRSQSSTILGGNGSAWREAWDIGLRVFPPNPWTYTAQKSMAVAGAYMAQAELRKAQVDLSAEVAVLFSKIQHLQADVSLLQQLTAMHKSIYEAYHALHVGSSEGLTTLGDDMLIWRRYQGAASDLNKARRDLDLARRELARYVAVPFASLSVDANSGALNEWQPPSTNAQFLLEQALNERADVAASGWKVVAAEAAHREAKSYRIPWFSQVEAAYGIASDGSDSSRFSEETRSQSETGQSTGARSGTASGTGSGTQTGSGEERAGGFTAETVTSSSTDSSMETGSSTQSSQSQESRRSQETTSSRQTIIDESDRDEWYVGFGVNIPIFSWTKSGVQARSEEHRHALDILDKVRQAAVRQVGDGLEALRTTEDARREYTRQAAADRTYLEQGIAKVEAEGALSASQILPLKANLLELQRVELELDHERRLAAIELQAALGHIVGVGRPIVSNGHADDEAPASPTAAGASESPLHAAVRSNDVHRVAALLLTLPPGAVNATTHQGVTPLHLAAAMNHREAAELLIFHGANVSAVTASGYTPLHWAALRNSAEAAKPLIAHGANVNARARNGITPLRWATEKNASDMVKLLLASGADAL